MVCRHGYHLLDADQPLPWPEQPLVRPYLTAEPLPRATW